MVVAPCQAPPTCDSPVRFATLGSGTALYNGREPVDILGKSCLSTPDFFLRRRIRRYRHIIGTLVDDR
jgi:hypothetical protein